MVKAFRGHQVIRAGSSSRGSSDRSRHFEVIKSGRAAVMVEAVQGHLIRTAGSSMVKAVRDHQIRTGGSHGLDSLRSSNQ
jgi:hypothetical protein